MQKPLYVARKTLFTELNRRRFNFFVLFCAISTIIGSATYIVFPIVVPLEFNITTIRLISVAVGSVPVIIYISYVIGRIIRVKTFKIQVFENRVVKKIGLIFSTEEEHQIFAGVTRIEVTENFRNRIIGAGDINFVCPGRFVWVERDILEPDKLKSFLDTHFALREETNVHLIGG